MRRWSELLAIGKCKLKPHQDTTNHLLQWLQWRRRTKRTQGVPRQSSARMGGEKTVQPHWRQLSSFWICQVHAGHIWSHRSTPGGYPGEMRAGIPVETTLRAHSQSTGGCILRDSRVYSDRKQTHGCWGVRGSYRGAQETWGVAVLVVFT